MNEFNREFSAVSVVLRATQQPLTTTTSLTDWLSDTGTPPTWVVTESERGVKQAIATLPYPQSYPLLFQSLCQQLASQKVVVKWRGKTYEVGGLEIHERDLYILNIAITPNQPINKGLSRAIHALFLNWISTANSDLATYLHQTDKFPVSLAILPVAKKKYWQLRIGLLQPHLLSPLLYGLSQSLGKKICLANITCVVAPEIRILSSFSYQELMKISPQNEIELRFTSPTSFKQQQNIQPLPLPELVFGSLQRRWNMFAPENLHFTVVEWQGLIAAFDIKTYALKMKAGVEIGCQGWVRYKFKDTTQMQIALTLAEFANFASVGRKTAMGMGQTRYF